MAVYFPLWVIRVRAIRLRRARHVRFASKADMQAHISLSPLCAKSGREQMQQMKAAIVRLFDHLVGTGEQRHRHI
jgi:hypothetical protein